MKAERRLRVEWKPQDCWVGAFWKRRRWWGGSNEMIRASTDEHYDRALAHDVLDVWVCLLPMVPLHFTRQTCPRPDECRTRHCTARNLTSLRELSRDLGLPEPTDDLLPPKDAA